MEAPQQKSQSKLTRTQSSLRSSPTIRSSIHSLSSIAEDECSSSSSKPVEEKPHRPNRSGSTPRTGSTRFSPVIAMASVVFSSFVLGYFLFFLFYLRSEEIATSENLLLALIFVAIALYFASKNKGLIQQVVNSIKQSARRLGLARTDSKPVLWFIGDSATSGSRKTPTRKGVVKEGVEFYSNGDCYEGEFHKGRCNGSGVYHYFASGRYEGDWIDGRYDGYGIESWARGSRYRGQYRQGMRHGYGVYRFYTGDTYAGEWCNGQSHGIGVQTCSDGSSYVGEFKYGVKHGLGCYHFRNGDRYSGEYFGDRIHGFGVYHFANGHSYEGSWHEGRKQGYGMYTFRSGDTRCGEWDSGNLKTPLPPPNNAVSQALQAARKAAEKAARLQRVDEMVNKAILAANRSANAARVAAIKAVQNQINGNFCDLDV